MKYDTSLNLANTPQRGTAVSLFALALAATNWFLTAGMVWIAFAAGMGCNLPKSVLLLPLANILATPQLRAAMPDVPDFGAPIG